MSLIKLALGDQCMVSRCFPEITWNHVLTQTHVILERRASAFSLYCVSRNGLGEGEGVVGGRLAIIIIIIVINHPHYHWFPILC